MMIGISATVQRYKEEGGMGGKEGREESHS
jgi:hypothetical protein